MNNIEKIHWVIVLLEEIKHDVEYLSRQVNPSILYLRDIETKLGCVIYNLNTLAIKVKNETQNPK